MTEKQQKDEACEVGTYRRLELINDKFHIIRRLLASPELCMSSMEIMDVICLAVDRVHSLYESLAHELRIQAGKKETGGE